MKTCSKCAAKKPVSEYYSGRAECKECSKAKSAQIRSLKTKAEIREYNQKYWQKNKKRLKAYNKEKYEANREVRLEYMKQYYLENKANFLAYNSNRRADLVKATPAWADKNEIKYIYNLASEKGLVVDHIVPLKNKKVCGLNTPDNLRCISREWNAKKSNKFYRD